MQERIARVSVDGCTHKLDILQHALSATEALSSSSLSVFTFNTAEN